MQDAVAILSLNDILFEYDMLVIIHMPLTMKQQMGLLWGIRIVASVVSQRQTTFSSSIDVLPIYRNKYAITECMLADEVGCWGRGKVSYCLDPSRDRYMSDLAATPNHYD